MYWEAAPPKIMSSEGVGGISKHDMMTGWRVVLSKVTQIRMTCFMYSPLGNGSKQIILTEFSALVWGVGGGI